MEYKSSQDMVVHCCEQLLADGKVHSLREMKAYVLGQKDLAGLDPASVKHTIVSNAMQLLISGKSPRYERVGYGLYQKKCPYDRSEKEPHEAVYQEIAGILQTARREIYARLPCCPTEQEIEEFMESARVGLQILNLLNQAISLTQRPIEPENFTESR